MANTPKKFVCIHGHFYQPPRENAWLETIEVQDSAAPYHDWNERINEECYAPNATARVLNDHDHISAISNNYARISWNFGPTLLSWLDEYDKATYARLQQADRDSQARFGGHGNALAQSYNHIIMPLANERDKQTQIRWGIEDFKSRFDRMPEGMWLAETAVDTDTLEALVDNGIKFTVLAPRQCRTVKHQHEDHWHEVNGGVDSRRPYRCPLPSGRTIDLFYYDGGVSKAVAFEGLLNDGQLLANRLTDTFDHNEEVQIAQIATDGESYGHHHKKGEMAMAFCLNNLDENPNVELTNYGQFLEMFPPEWETQIHDNSSWSCVHGVERWRSNCGCHTGGEAGWNQLWRAPLRAALDNVRERLSTVFETEGAPLFNDAWEARDAYIQLVLNRDLDNSEAFIQQHAKADKVPPDTKVRMLRLLEMQRHAMLMYTSCAWFFNEVTGIETLQVLQYANRALHLCEVVTGIDYHPHFIKLLEQVPSNVMDNAAISYRKNVMPSRVGLRRVGMHFAAASLFETDMHDLELFNYRADIHALRQLRAGSYRLAMGRMTIQSNLTHSKSSYCFAVLYLGQQTMIGSIRDDMSVETFETVVPQLENQFRAGHVGEVIGQINKDFGSETFSLWHLFRDEKRRILLFMTDRTLEIAAKNFSDVYYDNYQLMSTMRENGLPLPDAYKAAISFTLHRRLEDVLTDEELLDLPRLERVVAEYSHWKHSWKDADDLSKAAEDRLRLIVDTALEAPDNWANALHLLQSLKRLDLKPNFYRAQNGFLEGWTEEYVNQLPQKVMATGLEVAKELILEMGFEAEDILLAKASKTLVLSEY
ncbi:MAG: alpha-amylase/alpha-mannosidase (GH57 family) [Neolewinella sp.]|jgi:alpha-amylase/alpha-mannosidase (GH57 family)